MNFHLPQIPNGLLPSLRSSINNVEESTVKEVEKIGYGYAEEIAYLSILYTSLVIGIVIFLARYANRSLFKWHTPYLTLQNTLSEWGQWINVFLAYFSSLSILLLIPLDLVLTKLQRQVTSATTIDKLQKYSNNIYSIYGVMYWPTQILGNLILVLFEDYNESGYFTVCSRACDALMVSVKFYVAILVAAGIFLGVFIGAGYPFNEQALLVTLVALSNTYGLVLIVFLLGYGLVELPKQLWMNGNLQTKLRRLRGRAAHEFRALMDATIDMSEVVAHALKTKAEAEKLQLKDLDKFFVKVMKECPEEFRSQAGGVVQKNKKGKITGDVLAALRQQIKLKRQTYAMCQGRCERIKKQVFQLEDIVAAKSRDDKKLRIKWLSGKESSVMRFILECYIKPIFGRISVIFVMAMCLSVLLQEVGLMAGYDSKVAILSRAMHDPEIVPGGMIVLNLFYLGFIVCVILFALSQLRLANIMEIVPNQKTTPRSMSFNARLVCKLAPPLAYNYLTVCFESGVETGSWMIAPWSGMQVSTAFSQFYGSMDIIPFLGKNFNRVFPIFILVLAVLQAGNIFNRVLQHLRLGFLQFGDIPVDKKDMEEGMKKLQRYRKQMETQMEREQKMKQIKGTGFAFGGKKQKVAQVTALNDEEGASDVENQGGDDGVEMTPSGPPKLKEGWMEKKGAKEKYGGGWQNRYFVIRAPGVLVYYKKADCSGQPLGQLDLSKAQGVSLHQGKDGDMDATRLDLEMPDGTMKVRCRSDEYADEWREALSEWIGYAKRSAAHEKAGGGGSSATSGGNGFKIPLSSSEISLNNLLGKKSPEPKGKGAEEAKGNAVGDAMVSSLFSSTTNNRYTSSRPGKKGAPVMPKPFSGKLHMSNGLFGAYSERHVAIKTADSSLKYYKSSEPGATALGSIDLKSVEKVAFEEKNGKRDPLKFNIIVTGEKEPIKFKADTPQEAEEWINSLTQWNLYFKSVASAT